MIVFTYALPFLVAAQIVNALCTNPPKSNGGEGSGYGCSRSDYDKLDTTPQLSTRKEWYVDRIPTSTALINVEFSLIGGDCQRKRKRAI